MDDYRKIYEEKDEKGVTGFIIFFIATLMLFEPLWTIIVMFQTGRAFEKIPVAGIAYNICGISYLLFLFFTCFCFYKLPKLAMRVAKSFLITRVIFLATSMIIYFNFLLHDERFLGVRSYQFVSIPDMVIKVLLLPGAYIIIYSVFWYIFMNKSKAIKENYGSSNRIAN